MILTVLCAAIGLQAQNKETPNAQQARRLFNETYKMIYGDQGSQLHYKVNIIGIYKTEGTIWTKGKKSKFIDEKYIAWNDDVTYYRLERKKNRVVIYDAHSEERDKYATKFKFNPDNYTYSIKDSKDGYYITLKAKKGVSGIKEARCLLDKKHRYPVSGKIQSALLSYDDATTGLMSSQYQYLCNLDMFRGIGSIYSNISDVVTCQWFNTRI